MITNSHLVSQSTDPAVVRAAYVALRLALLKQLEGNEDQVYFDTAADANPTIGIGLNLSDTDVRTRFLIGMGVTDVVHRNALRDILLDPQIRNLPPGELPGERTHAMRYLLNAYLLLNPTAATNFTATSPPTFTLTQQQIEGTFNAEVNIRELNVLFSTPVAVHGKAERSTSRCSTYGPVARRIAASLYSAVLIATSAGCASDLLGQESPQFLPGPGRTSLELIKGGGAPLCDAYARSWTQSSSSDRGFNSALAFRAEDLGTLRRGDEDDERLLVNKVRDFLWTRDVNPAKHFPIDRMSEWRGTPEQLLEARDDFGRRFWTEVVSFGYRIGSMDIDNDGELDNVFSMMDSGGFPLLVLNKDGTDVDAAKTEGILMHPSRRRAGWPDVRPAWPDELRIARWTVNPVQDAYMGAVYSLMSFSGKVYIGFQWDVHPEYSIPDWSARRTQHIYEVESGQRTEQCEIRWHF